MMTSQEPQCRARVRLLAEVLRKEFCDFSFFRLPGSAWSSGTVDLAITVSGRMYSVLQDGTT